MENRLTRGVLLFGFLTATAGLLGCDEDARDFATKTKIILDQRSAQLSRKIASERETYDKEAAAASEDHRALVDSTLQNERNERTDSLSADYEEGRKPVSLWRKDLSDYAKIDYTTNREILISEMDASTLYLQKLDDLKIEQDKVDALSKLLSTLANKPSIKNEIGALASFAEDTKQEFDQKVCTQLKSQKSGTDAAAKAASKTYDAKKCDDVLKSK